ncbi:MAG: hypothetical protein ACYC08_10995, partial [Armatimonadota bacterium]
MSEADEARMAVELETRCNIDLDTALEESTWYSVMNVISLSLGSGMGISVTGDEMLRMFGDVGICPAELPMSNPAILTAFFKNGDPHLSKSFDERDLETWRWSPESFDKVLVPQAQGWSIIAETECAKIFGIVEGDESLPPELRKDWMINSLLLAVSARKQCEFAFDNLRNDQGFFALQAQPGSVNITEPGANLEDQMVMLWACADTAMLASCPGSIFWMENDFTRGADDLFAKIARDKDALIGASVNRVQAYSIAVPALVWYASVTEAQDLKARCLTLLREFADELVKARDANEMVGDTLVDAAAAMRALSEAYRVTGLRTYAESATEIFNFIESQWWKLPGLYSQTPLAAEYTYNADDIGTILGALNAGRLILKERINRSLAELRMRVFFCNAVNFSGLQMSMPSIDILPDWVRQRESEAHFRHESVPLTSDAGIAPVFAGEVGFDARTQTWSRRMIFDAQAAM